jgi:muramoyltetrapeptide carboxypeptidase LdcA involved in peptidoglycan recycling
MGFSDITTFNTYFNQLGLVTFNGPTVMAGFAESYELQNEFIKHIESFLFGGWQEFSYEPFLKYTNEYLDWNEPENLERENPNYVENTTKWRCVQGQGSIEGELFGGCIEVLEFMKGTKYWPRLEFFENKILFFETSEEKPTPEQVEHFLRNYGMQGILSRINAILFGRAKNYSSEEKKEIEEKILKVLKEFNREDLLVITNLDFGHTDPQIILPLGIKAKITLSPISISLLESCWK